MKTRTVGVMARRVCSGLVWIVISGWAPTLVEASEPPFRIGLNAPFIGSGSMPIADQLTMMHDLRVAGLRHVAPGDVGWGEVQRPNGLYTFTNADSVMVTGAGLGLKFVPTFFGSGDNNCYVPPGTSSSVAWSSSSFASQTSSYIQTVVNRYKGTTQHWEVANEMDGKTTPPAGLTVTTYAELLGVCRTAVRAADPQGQVVLAGVLGNYGYPMENARQWLRDLLAAPGGTSFDVFNFHDYKSWWTLASHYDQYRAILDAAGLQSVPIWVSETAQASVFSNANINPSYASVDGQAADTWRRPCLLFGKGAQTVFWHSFWDNSNDTSGFRNMGFVSASTGVRKKAWYSFRLLNQKIEGFTSATLVSQGNATDDNTNGGNGVWVVRFDFADGTRRWVAWSPDGQTATLADLTRIAAVNLTTVVPSALSSDGLTPTWSTSSAIVHSNSVTVPLSALPVLLEVSASYDLWMQARFSAGELADTSISGENADPDGDGLGNLVEYALGSDPRVAGNEGALLATSVVTSSSDGQPHLQLTATLSASATDITCTPHVSDDLQTWTSAASSVEIVSDTTSGNVRTLVARDTTPLGAGAHRFLRLAVGR